MLLDLGIEPDRVRLEWISASEAERVKTVINEMVKTIEGLGPLGLPDRFAEWDQEMASLDQTIHQQQQTQPEVAHA